MKRLRVLVTTERARRDEHGGALILVLIIGVLMLSAGSLIIRRTTTESRLADKQSEFEGALHAAEAGVHDYIAKLTEDRIYFRHRVHPAEDTRTRVDGVTTVGPNQVWPGDETWTYPATKTQFRALLGSSSSDYEYNLRITAISGQPVMITATGRRRSNPRVTRTIEVQVKGSSIADYQAIYDQSVNYGSTASTTGRIYSTGNINYLGTASADVLAEGTVSGPAKALNSGAQMCDSGLSFGCDIRDKLKTPISFSQFTASFDEIKRVAQSAALGGVYLNNASAKAWRITFKNTGKMDVEMCTMSSHPASGSTPPGSSVCSVSLNNVDVPKLGVIYAEQSTIVLGQVKGRVTVASNADLIIGGAISYVDDSVDVVGLLAKNSVIVAEYNANSFTWKGAVLAQTGMINYYGPSSSGPCTGLQKTGTMTFIGSWASKGGACMATTDFLHGYNTRIYNYDPNLSNLQPPFLPVLEDAYKILRYREV